MGIAAMGLDLLTVLGVLALTLLTIFLTGPGMWSEKWGWGWFTKGEKAKPKEPDAGPERVQADLPLRAGERISSQALEDESAPPPPGGRGPSSS